MNIMKKALAFFPAKLTELFGDTDRLPHVFLLPAVPSRPSFPAPVPFRMARCHRVQCVPTASRSWLAIINTFPMFDLSIIRRALRALLVTFPNRIQQAHPTDKLVHALLAAWLLTFFEFTPMWTGIGYIIVFLISWLRERLSDQPDKDDFYYAGIGATIEFLRWGIAHVLTLFLF